MENRPPPARYGPDYTPKMVAAIASCSTAIGRLDARITASPVAKPWAMRAAWSGYAKALQLQSAEIEEIDVFSWGCGLQIPGRPIRATHLDQFDRFDEWREALREKDALSWRDALPTAVGEPSVAADHPPLIRALDCIRQHARTDGTIAPWIGLPFALRDQRLTSIPLPCLAGGAKAYRLKRQPSDLDWLAVIRALETAASLGLQRLGHLERLYRDARCAIVGEYRAGALPSLIALSCHRPLLSPRSVSQLLSLSVAGASKLLERAVETGLLVEITRRRSWRVFLATDLSVDLGFAAAKRGRPKNEPPPLPASRDLTAVFDAFDTEMAAIDALLSRG